MESNYTNRLAKADAVSRLIYKFRDDFRVKYRIEPDAITLSYDLVEQMVDLPDVIYTYKECGSDEYYVCGMRLTIDMKRRNYCAVGISSVV